MEDSFGFSSNNDSEAHSRASVRDSMFLQAALYSERAAEPMMLRVRNLSAGGLMGEVAGHLERGEAIEVELRGIGRVGGRIAWRSGERTGISFDAPIDPKLARKPVGTGKALASIVPRPSRPGFR